MQDGVSARGPTVLSVRKEAHRSPSAGTLYVGARRGDGMSHGLQGQGRCDGDRQMEKYEPMMRPTPRIGVFISHIMLIDVVYACMSAFRVATS